MIDSKATQLAAECCLSLATRKQWTQGTPTYGKPDAENVVLGARIVSYVLTQLRDNFRDADDAMAALDATADEIERFYFELFPVFEAKGRQSRK